MKSRDFPLDCFVEDITEAQREGLLQWLDRRTAGQLIFDDRPFVAYAVRPVKRVEIKQYTQGAGGRRLISGTFTIAFRCFDPFGVLLRNTYTDTPGGLELVQTGLLHADVMPVAPGPADRQFLLYNPGTERAHTRIQLAGDVGDGLVIENAATGQQCGISGLKADALPEGAYLDIDSRAGQVWLAQGEERSLAFHYHDLGYLMLEPCTPFVRSLRVLCAAGDTRIESEGAFLPHMAGQYVHLDGMWRKIHRVEDAGVAHLSQASTGAGWQVTPVVTMNEVSLRGDGVSLTKFAVQYGARVR